MIKGICLINHQCCIYNKFHLPAWVFCSKMEFNHVFLVYPQKKAYPFMYIFLCEQISIPDGREEHVLDCLLGSSKQEVKLAGLGARDSLRLEAGLCLYGSDISDQTTPVEAALMWLIGEVKAIDTYGFG